MEVLHLPAQGTVIMIQGGLALLGVAFAVKYLIDRYVSRKR